MPLNGNPHPLPGQLVNDNLQFALPLTLLWDGMQCRYHLKIQWYLLLLMTVVGDSRQLLLMEEDGNLRRPQKHPLLILFRTRSPW